MDTPEQRAAVVAEALTWKGTPYHHQSNIKGVGVDCAMFLIEAYGNVGVLKKFDPRPYSSDWFLHHSEEKYLQTLIPFAKEISVRDAKSGDIILMKLGRTFSHSAIVVEGSVVILNATGHPSAAIVLLPYDERSSYTTFSVVMGGLFQLLGLPYFEDSNCALSEANRETLGKVYNNNL